MAAGPGPTESLRRALHRSRSTSSPSRRASAPRRWATPCSCSSRTSCSSATASRSSPPSPRRARPSTILDAAMKGPRQPLVFTTIADDTISGVLRMSRAPIIDFVSSHLGQLERILGSRALHLAVRVHGIGRPGEVRPPDAGRRVRDRARRRREPPPLRRSRRDPARTVPVREDADDHVPRPAAQRVRGELPAVPEDLEVIDLPDPVRDAAHPLLRHPDHARAPQPGPQRAAPGLDLRSIEQCRWELRRAEIMFRSHRIPTVNSSAKSVEEMSTVILQHMNKA